MRERSSTSSKGILFKSYLPFTSKQSSGKIVHLCLGAQHNLPTNPDATEMTWRDDLRDLWEHGASSLRKRWHFIWEFANICGWEAPAPRVNVKYKLTQSRKPFLQSQLLRSEPRNRLRLPRDPQSQVPLGSCLVTNSECFYSSMICR